MKNIDLIKEMDAKELASFIINTAPVLALGFTDSQKGMEQWLNKEAYDAGNNNKTK